MPEPLKSVAKVLRTALHVEFRTAPGKYNVIGTVMAVLLVIVLCITDVFRFLLKLARVPDGGFEPDYGQLFKYMFYFFLFCMVIMVLEYFFADRHLGPPSKGRHRKD